jgi:uncharacterized protein
MCLPKNGDKFMQFNSPAKILVTGLLLACASLPVWAEKVSMESASTNSVVGLMPQAMASYWGQAGVEVELALGQTLTKSLLKLGQGTLDSSVVPPPAYGNLVKGVGPYQSLGSKGAELAGNVRSLFGFAASVYHPIVWADGGVANWAQAKGKRIFVGPPAGAANAQIRALVKNASGLEDGTDYEGIKAPWNSATQNFKDGQFDVHIVPVGMGAQVLVELGLTRKFRMLSLDAKAEPPVGMGMVMARIPAGTYPGQVNQEDVYSWQTVMTMMVNKNMSDDTAYKLTKTYFEKLPEVRKGNELLKDLNESQRFGGMLPPLHPGAARYYKEQGIAIPAELMPK